MMMQATDRDETPTDTPYECPNYYCGLALFAGARVSKGARRADWCPECGGLVSGIPGIANSVYRWVTGRWLHQSESDE